MERDPAQKSNLNEKSTLRKEYLLDEFNLAEGDELRTAVEQSYLNGTPGPKDGVSERAERLVQTKLHRNGHGDEVIFVTRDPLLDQNSHLNPYKGGSTDE